MKIAFFSEIGQDNGIMFPRNYHNMRTDVAWSVALNAPVYSFSTKEFPAVDLAIMICPKKNPEHCFHFFERFKEKCLFANVQEGPQYGFQDFSVENQLSYLSFLSELDFIFAHNEQDRLYFKGIFPEKEVHCLPSLLIEDSIPSIPYEVRSGSLISGNMTTWYGGMDSFIVGQILGEQVYAPSMGRKQQGEELIDGLIHLPYMSWQDWFLQLNKRKYGVNLMRTFAAGSFSLACARLKVPCLGWGRNDDNELSSEGTDTQRLLFPELTVPTGNMVKMVQVSKHLRDNSLFYDHVAEYAAKAYNEIYSETIFIDKLREILK